MSKFVLKGLYLFQIRPFSSSKFSSSTLKSLDRSSFTANYLINSCGFTSEKAVSVSKYMNFENADKPDAVLAFFNDQGFTQTQISKLIGSCPVLLRSNPEKNFLPKIEFLKTKGILGSEVAAIVSKSPTILTMSLKNRLSPSFDVFSNLFQSDEKTKVVFKRFLGSALSHRGIYMKSNIEMLKQAGVPVRNIEYCVAHRPRILLSSCNRNRWIMEEVKMMGFNPSEIRFLRAVEALLSITKLTWDRKIAVYKQWSWSENDIITAFRRFPGCMGFSENKINSVMEFFVNKIGLKPSFLAHRPELLSYSLEKRIVPRCVLYQALVSKGFMKPGDSCLTTIIECTEKHFLQRFIARHEDEAPELLKLYKQKLDLAK